MITFAILDSDKECVKKMEKALQKEHYQVYTFSTTQSFYKELKKTKFDFLILERKLKSIDGCDYLEFLHEKGYDFLTIFVTDKTGKKHIKEGLKCGADDYICKPCDIEEVMLRIEGLLRRSTKAVSESEITYKDLTIKPQERLVICNGKTMKLSRLEYELLHTFVTNVNKVLEWNYLFENVWGSFAGDKKVVNIAVRRLRKKIDPEKNKNYIESVRGVGYIFS